MFKAIALALLLVVAVFAQDQPIDTVASTDTTALDGVPENLKTLVSQDAPKVLDGRLELTPKEAELALIRAAVAADPNIAAADLLPFAANLSDIVPIRDSLLATINAAVPAWTAYRAEVVANLTAFLADWKEKVQNLTANRDLAVTDVQSLIERAKAVYWYQAAKIGQRLIAANLFAFYAEGELAEFKLRAAVGAVWIINNTIARLNNSQVGDLNWTYVNNSLVKAKLIELGVALKIAEWRVEKIKNFLDLVKIQSAKDLKELNDKVADFAKGVYTAVQDLKAAWKATADLNLTLAERIEDFLENVTGIKVTVTGLDGTGNVSVSIEITRVFPSSETAAAIRAWLAKHIRVLLVTLTGAKEEEVSAEATEKVTMKRGALQSSTYAVTSQIGSAPSNNNNNQGSSASAVFASVAAVALAFAAVVA